MSIGVETADLSLFPDRDHQLKWLRMYLEIKNESEGKKSSDIDNEDVERLYDQVTIFVVVSKTPCP